MKRLYFTTIIFLNSIAFVYSQGLTQNADGQSSILTNSTNVSFDLAKANLNLSINNLSSTIGVNNHYLFGANISGENAEGISNLLSSGEIVPQSNGNLFLGWSFSNAIVHSDGKQQDYINNRKKTAEKKYIKSVSDDFIKEINKVIPVNNDDVEIKKIKHDLLDSIGEERPFSSIKKILEEKKDDGSNIKEIKNKLLTRLEILKKKYGDIRDTELKKCDDLLELTAAEYSKKRFQRFLVFGFGGISATEFKRFTTLDTANIKNSFKNEDFSGNNIGIGVNYQWGNLFLGATYSYVKSDNFKFLSKKQYTLRSTQSYGNQTLIEEKSITAYAGSYGSVSLNQLNIDFIWNLSLDEKAKNHLLINPYFNAQIFSRDTSLLPNSMNAGCGFYLYNDNNKFMGGMYTEIQDLRNNYEKAKPVSEQKLKGPFKRVTFGIVAKFSINSILGY